MDLKELNSFLRGPFIFLPRYRIWRHCLYWTLHVLLWAAFWTYMGPEEAGYGRSLFNMLMWVPVFILFSYPLVYLAVPLLLLKGKLWQFFIAVILWGAVGIMICSLFRTYILFPVKLFLGFEYLPSKGFQMQSYLCMTTSAASPMAVQFFKLMSIKQKELADMRMAKIRADLQLLKAQVHPEFFFQTLSSIHDRSVHDPARTPDLILKLSSLLSYMLYNCKLPTVGLEKEALMMRYYTELEQERCMDKMDVSWSVDGEVAHLFIAPLLILPFLENAFKHGVSPRIERSWLAVNISVKGDDVLFKIANSKEAGILFPGEGEGLARVRSRLEMIYPGAHQLKWHEEDDFFVVTLQLELSACTASMQDPPQPITNVKTKPHETTVFAGG